MCGEKRNIVKEKSYTFALEIVNLCKYLRESKRDSILSNQILRSGVSIGSNIEESVGSNSKRDFIFKMSIAYRESRETRYWLRLLKDAEYIDLSKYVNLESKCAELIKILGKIIATTKSNMK
ncbi:MAG: four helix bundle protein [Ignavibacteria bacterium]|nr:four helix bundle protein [Ignavibacteria bacterium]